MITEIPINQGVYKSQNQNSVKNTAYAEDLINIFIGVAGNNYDRPTLDLLTTLDSIEPIGIYYFDSVFVVVTLDRNIYTVSTTGTITNITSTQLPGEDRPVFTNNGNMLIIAGGEDPIKWEGQGNVTELLGGSPPFFGSVVYLDGFILGNRLDEAEGNKVIEFSTFDDPEEWTGTFFTCNAAPDPIQGLAVAQRELFAIGEVTTEIWQNIGADPVPFARSFVFQYGTRAKNSILSADNSVFFIDQDSRFIRISGRELVRLSESVEEEWARYETIDDAITYSFTWKGSLHIIVYFPSVEKLWSIDLRNSQWTEWRGYSSDWVRTRFNCCYYSSEVEMTLAGDFSTGKLWVFSEDEKTDAQGVFVRERVFCQRDGGASVKKMASFIRINMKRNVASAYEGTTDQINPTLEIKWKDDGKFWSNWRRISLGLKGEIKNYIETYRLGIFRTRQYCYRFSDPSELNITSIETDEEVMTS